jgi:hypothetical protein
VKRKKQTNEQTNEQTKRRNELKRKKEIKIREKTFKSEKRTWSK